MSFEIKVDGDKDFGPRGAFDLEHGIFYHGIYEGNECIFVRLAGMGGLQGSVITFYPSGRISSWSDTNNQIRGAREVKVTMTVTPYGGDCV